MGEPVLSQKNLMNHNQQMMAAMNPISQRDINPNPNPLGDVRQSKKRGAGASSDLVGKNRGNRGSNPLTDVR